MPYAHPTEVFRVIPGYNGHYRAGDWGTIQSCTLRRSKSRKIVPWWTLKPAPCQRYWRVVLTDETGKSRLRFVHHLVLEAFVGPCPEGMECRHLDDDGSNNALSNLAWGTRLENTADRRANGGYVHDGDRNPRAKLTSEKVGLILEKIASGLSKKEIAREFGVSLSTVYGIGYGDRWNRITTPER